MNQRYQVTCYSISDVNRKLQKTTALSNSAI